MWAVLWKAGHLRAIGDPTHSGWGWVHWPRKESGCGDNSVYLEGGGIKCQRKVTLDRLVRESSLRKHLKEVRELVLGKVGRVQEGRGRVSPSDIFPFILSSYD